MCPAASHYEITSKSSTAYRSVLCATICILLLAEICSFTALAQSDAATGAVSPGATNTVASGATNSIEELVKLPFEQFMEQPVTTVERRPSTVGQSPAAVTVITQEDIQRSGATTIPELFRRVPGADVARIDGNKWAVGVRGFNARFEDKLLVQMDGRSVYNPLFSGVYWDALDYPLEDIERIEVIRGPGASVWGANAVNGVINIVTKSAKDTQGGLLSGGGGNVEQGFGTFRYGGTIKTNLYYRIYGQGWNRAEQFSQTTDPHDAWHGGDTGFRLDWQPNPNDLMTMDGNYTRSVAGRKDLRATTNSASVATDGGLRFTNAFVNIENETTDAAHVLGRWAHTLDTDNNWSVQMYWDHFYRDFDNLLLHQRWDIFDVDFQHQLLHQRFGVDSDRAPPSWLGPTARAPAGHQ